MSTASTAATIYTLFPKDQVLVPDDGEAYEASIKRWADNAVRRAEYVILPKSSQDVAKAVIFAVSNGLDLAIKGGGHSCSSASSSEGLVIDLSKHMNTVDVGVEEQLIIVGGGAVWSDVDTEAARYSLATVGGTVNHTGVGGLTVGGGYGWLTGRYGLTIDSLVRAEVVTASGEIVACNAEENVDLFWAIRGGGSNFGVVTSFVFKGYPQADPIWSGLLIFAPPQLESLVTAASVWARSASADEGMMIFLACPPPYFEPGIAAIPFFNGPAAEARERFKSVLEVQPVADTTREMPYEELNGLQNSMATYGDRKLFKTAAMSVLDPTVIHGLFGEYCELVGKYPEAKGSAIMFELHNYKKLLQVPSDMTAFANRGAWYNMNIALRWKSAERDAEMRSWSSTIAMRLGTQEVASKGATVAVASGYSNYGLGDERARDVFGANYERLRVVKARYDPDSIFTKWFPIMPSGVEGSASS